jgi:hypothetical protein
MSSSGFDEFFGSNVIRNEYGVAGDRANVDAGEFDWGAGLTPPGLENALPNEGGRYQGIPPDGPHSQVRMDSDLRI